MRALRLAVLVWALAIAGGLSDYALGTSYGSLGLAENMTSGVASLNTTVTTDYFAFMVDSVMSVLVLVKNIIVYGLLLGSLAQAFSPIPLPPAFIAALDGFSLLANALAIAQWISGRSTQTME